MTEVTEERAYIAARAAKLLEVYKDDRALLVHTYMKDILNKIGFGETIDHVLNDTSDGK